MVDLFGLPNATRVTDCTVGRTRSYKLVRKLVAEWHSSLPYAPPGFRIAFVAYAPNLAPIAVAMWGRPTARMEDQKLTLELTRQAHAPEAPYNMGSWFLGKMRKHIREIMPEIVRLISYQNADIHHGTIYKADNWTMVYEKFTDHSWLTRPGRRGTEVMHKIKWERKP